MHKDNLKSLLELLKTQHLLRQRKVLSSAQDVQVKINNRNFLNFTSNDYLGLANHPKVKQAMLDGVKEYGVGSGAAHFISGHQTPHHELELAMADFFNAERALLFSSGFMANLGVIDSLCNKDSLLLQDKLNHASLLDAGRLSRAKFKRFRHLDMEQLQNLLQKNQSKNILLASDAVFSMDGDLANIKALSKLSDGYKATLLLDEAHSFGVLGKYGQGLGVKTEAIRIATMGKALGTYGAVVLGYSEQIEYILQKARTYIYTTALPPAIAYASLAALEILKKSDEPRAHLQKLIQRFRTNMQNLNLNLLDSTTPIQPLLIGSNKSALKLADKLYAKSILVQAVRPPTVPVNTARIRITFSAKHTLADVDILSQEIQNALCKKL